MGSSKTDRGHSFAGAAKEPIEHLTAHFAGI
jgi:hypothetical protein